MKQEDIVTEVHIRAGKHIEARVKAPKLPMEHKYWGIDEILTAAQYSALIMAAHAWVYATVQKILLEHKYD